MATPSMFSEGHRRAGYTYHNMFMRELPIMAELLPEVKQQLILTNIHSFKYQSLTVIIDIQDRSTINSTMKNVMPELIESNWT